MHLRRQLTAVLILAATFFFAAAAGAQTGTDDPAQLETGQEIFELNCSGCHGEDGTGGVGRPLLDIAIEEPDRSVHIASVTDGKGGMPAFGGSLSVEEIDAAVSYVRLTFGGAEAPATDEVEEAAAPEALAETGAESARLIFIGVTSVLLGCMILWQTNREIDLR